MNRRNGPHVNSGSIKHVTAVILAGGSGSRLRSMVADRPKVLAMVLGRPFLAYLLDQLTAAGITRAVLCTGYMGELVQGEFGDFHGPISLAYSRELSPMGTAGALRLALPFCDSETLLVMNGDTYCKADHAAFLAWHTAQGSEATLLLVRAAGPSLYGCVDMDEKGRLLSFSEKGNNQETGWINGGTYLLSRSRLLSIPAGKTASLEREVFPAWLEKGIHGYKSEGRFLDIGTPETFAAAKYFFENK